MGEMLRVHPFVSLLAGHLCPTLLKKAVPAPPLSAIVESKQSLLWCFGLFKVVLDGISVVLMPPAPSLCFARV